MRGHVHLLAAPVLAALCIPAFALSGGGMDFHELQWSPDSRFLCFTYDWITDDDDNKSTADCLAFYDTERGLAWSPQEGVSLWIPEFETHYVANRLGVFGLPSVGGPWRCLLGPEAFIRSNGAPSFYLGEMALRYNADTKVLTCLALPRMPCYPGQPPLVIQLALPEGKVLSVTSGMDLLDPNDPNVYSDAFLRFLDALDIEPPRAQDVFPPVPRHGQAGKEQGILLYEVAPRLTHMEWHEHERYWSPPNALVLLSTPRRALWDYVPGGDDGHDEVYTLSIPPEGLVRPSVALDQGLARWHARDAWKEEASRALPELVRLSIHTPEGFPYVGGLVVTLDEQGTPSQIQQPYRSGLSSVEPKGCRGDYAHSEGPPSPNGRVALFPTAPRMSHPCTYYTDLAEVSQIHFRSMDEARGLGALTLPLLRKWLLEHAGDKPLDTRAVAVNTEKVRVADAKWLVSREHHQYLLLYDRLWVLDELAGNLRLVHPSPVGSVAVSPDGRCIAASLSNGYCGMRLVLFDLAGDTINQVLPPVQDANTASGRPPNQRFSVSSLSDPSR